MCLVCAFSVFIHRIFGGWEIAQLDIHRSNELQMQCTISVGIHKKRSDFTILFSKKKSLRPLHETGLCFLQFYQCRVFFLCIHIINALAHVRPLTRRSVSTMQCNALAQLPKTNNAHFLFFAFSCLFYLFFWYTFFSGFHFFYGQTSLCSKSKEVKDFVNILLHCSDTNKQKKEHKKQFGFLFVCVRFSSNCSISCEWWMAMAKMKNVEHSWKKKIDNYNIDNIAQFIISNGCVNWIHHERSKNLVFFGVLTMHQGLFTLERFEQQQQQ